MDSNRETWMVIYDQNEEHFAKRLINAAKGSGYNVLPVDASRNFNITSGNLREAVGIIIFLHVPGNHSQLLGAVTSSGTLRKKKLIIAVCSQRYSQGYKKYLSKKFQQVVSIYPHPGYRYDKEQHDNKTLEGNIIAIMRGDESE